MSSTSLPSSTQSIPVTFKIGRAGTMFYVHSELLAAQSPSLEKLVVEHATEQHHGSVHWGDVDEAIFSRFVSYIYTGDYKEAKVVPRHGMIEYDAKIPGKEDSAVSETLSQSTDSSWDHPAQRQPNQRRRNRKRPWSQFLNLHPEPTQPEEFVDERGDHTELFLSNAEIYVFAKKHDIEGLQELSLRKLRAALEELLLDEFNDEAIGDVADLVKYTYKATKHQQDDKEPLRHLVTLYAACKIDILWTWQSFRDLVENNGQLSKGLITHMLGRL
ncbi:hypothetical protein CGMCC3_g6884 [Colletotrichum fructicola]|uniref:BTB domain-containing protein n=1 Tax=Colletotrichum fructicola (strain Nara gc5) TaxID=1213859 RepID=L2GCD2_COLFN|nr:uncharacterized protein CGMCC3_g6884 [Colletotrichum fructicola]KAE9577015.1 hypothetical protein CGMCC3_g6884 [Colletotrichum fructicola]KAF4416467.1 hypothetical protein CFRS1_v003977 [Colletotrichum fructicola]KAF4483831.1 hypothetical protein CGGC5_v007535 [Colletotrichum fructicola Nara gc5]